MKYDMIPTMSGMKRSDLFDVSLSVPSFLAQNNMIAMGSMDAKISETTSNAMNLLKSNPLPLNESITQIIKNNGMQMIGGLVNVEICLAIFNLFIFIL
jgi:methylglyoxal synthase